VLGLRDWLLLVGVMLAVVLEILDVSIVNVALPLMRGNLGATIDEISWVATAYIIANVVVIPMTSWLSGRFARRRYFVGSIILFTFASFLCGAARTLPQIVAFRILQGMGGGALLAVAQALIVEIFPAERQGTGQAIFGMGAMLGPSLGPTLGGWITEQWSWSWIFWVNVPLGIVAAILCWSYLPRSQPGSTRRAGRVDWVGVAALIVGIAALQTVLERGNRLDWFESDFISALSLIAVVALGFFIYHELTTRDPIVDLRVFRNRALVIGCTYGTAMGIGLYGSIFLFPLFSQGVLHWTTWQSGMGVLPASLATACMMPIVGRLLWKLGPAPLFGAGVAIFLPTMWTMSLWTAQSGYWDVFWPQVGRGIAMGLMFVPLSTVTMRSLPPEDVLQGAGLYNLSRQLGGSFGIAILATMIDHRAVLHHARLAESVSLFQEATRFRLGAIAAGLAQRGLDPVQAQLGAVQVLGGIVSREASVMAFRDAFLMIFVLFVLLAPLVPLLRRPPASAQPGLVEVDMGV
jgi:MFS transporter, DHA2 family, multidrug resistance protein